MPIFRKKRPCEHNPPPVEPPHDDKARFIPLLHTPDGIIILMVKCAFCRQQVNAWYKNGELLVDKHDCNQGSGNGPSAEFKTNMRSLNERFVKCKCCDRIPSVKCIYDPNEQTYHFEAKCPYCGKGVWYNDADRLVKRWNEENEQGGINE
jgi:hypothetical protein